MAILKIQMATATTECNVRNIGVGFLVDVVNSAPHRVNQGYRAVTGSANTAVGSEMGFPLASHTVNFTGTVLPTFHTLLPSELIGGKITSPGFGPVHVP